MPKLLESQVISRKDWGGVSSPKPRLKRKFSFDYDGKRGQSSVDDILDSMNRTTQAGEILDYDPEIESYLEHHAGRGGGSRRRGKAIFGLMLVLGVGILWFYGGLTRVMNSAWLKTKYTILGQAVPLWIGLSIVFLFFLGMLVARRRGTRVALES